MNASVLRATGLAVIVSLALTACGNLFDSDDTGNAPNTGTPPASSTNAGCDELPALPAKPARTRSVLEFGAVPNDGRDDTAAIQRALDTLADGEWLVFPAGTYEHNASLRVRRQNATLWSEGATLHATNPSDQAIWISVSGASVYNFRLTAVTEKRRTTPWESRIAVFDRVDNLQPLERNVIRGNTITQASQAAGPLGNSASSAGIFLYRATDFLVADNRVSRSLADGIHITGGSSNGRVLKNTVRETGDDMVAIVSYIGDGDWTRSNPTLYANQLNMRRSRDLNRNILVSGNDVSGQYWGRGVTVVGGRDVTIRNNRITRTTMAAGVLIAREESWQTFGVSNVLVTGNTIEQVQTTAPSYVPDTSPRPLTYQGAVEIHALLLREELANPTLAAELAVERVAVENNRVSEAIQDGVRIGAGWGSEHTLTANLADGTRVRKTATGGTVRAISVANNQVSNVRGSALKIFNHPPADQPVYCSNATGGQSADPKCSSTNKPIVTGASMTCRRT